MKMFSPLSGMMTTWRNGRGMDCCGIAGWRCCSQRSAHSYTSI